jgi:hypothetical protein
MARSTKQETDTLRPSDTGRSRRKDDGLAEEYERGRSTFEEDENTGAVAPSDDSAYGDEDALDDDDEL